jgi:3-hydroxybutyryl-CoA dehydratase
MFDKVFEGFSVGDRWRSPRGRTVTETDVVNFCGLSGDFYPLHSDAVWAEQGPFGRRIAHGLLVLSLTSGLVRLEPGYVWAFYGIDRLRFPAPTFIGDTLWVELEVTETAVRDERFGVVAAAVATVNQRAETVMAGTWRLAVPRRHPLVGASS